VLRIEGVCAFGLLRGEVTTDVMQTLPLSIVPTFVNFHGMPNHRWWDFERGSTDFGAVTPDLRDVAKLVERGGLVAPKGPAGSMILFHSCLVHASTSNLSPWNRVSVYLSLCAVSNHIRRFKRPEYIAHRDFAPIRCLPDDCLLKEYDVPLPWKDGTPEAALKPQLAA